ncbi:hypothetical protein SETIT_9G114300v2, partial [Setaria italica]
FADWWRKSYKKVGKAQRKGFNSTVILGAWTLWNHRNKGVFDGAALSLQAAHQFFKDELRLWGLAGAKKIQDLFQERVHS